MLAGESGRDRPGEIWQGNEESPGPLPYHRHITASRIRHLACGYGGRMDDFRPARGCGVCLVFAGRRSAACVQAGRRLADSHLASPTAMHAVGPPPFPRSRKAMPGGAAMARESGAPGPAGRETASPGPAGSETAAPGPAAREPTAGCPAVLPRGAGRACCVGPASLPGPPRCVGPASFRGPPAAQSRLAARGRLDPEAVDFSA